MEAVERALAAIQARDGAINAFTAVLARRARATLKKKRRGPLAGVPFAV
jgi:Asp-tRNA(Asn)/Glu-tRNA(Gln) amidotransferase A subunit family amidase